MDRQRKIISPSRRINEKRAVGRKGGGVKEGRQGDISTPKYALVSSSC